VDSDTSDLNSPGSWTVRKETDGSTSVVTMGQRIVPEIKTEYRSQSKVFRPKGMTLNGTEGYVKFETQPEGRYYVLQGTIQWTGNNNENNMPVAGFRVLASDQEWTDIYFDPSNETLVVDRSSSSLVPSCASIRSLLQLPHQCRTDSNFDPQMGRMRSMGNFVCGISSREIRSQCKRST
jgi:beta-fructofuranosidase